MAPSRHDWKIVDWDVKPQHNQPNPYEPLISECSPTFHHSGLNQGTYLPIKHNHLKEFWVVGLGDGAR